MNDILSQDEIDALLTGVDDGDVETETGVDIPDEQLTGYDFSSQDRIVRGRMPALDIINERFSRYFSESLLGMLRRSGVVSESGVQLLKFSEYVHSLFTPTSLNLVKIRPFRGTALFALEPKLVFALVDNYFGGGGRFQTKIEGREFTLTEQRIVRLVLDLVFKHLARAWQPLAEIEFNYQSTEVNPHFAAIVGPSDVVVVSTFHIDLEGSGGDLHITIPYAMLEPVRALLESNQNNDPDEIDDRWQRAISNEIKKAYVDISSTLTRTSISLRELNALQAGDVIPVELPELVTLEAESVPVFRGKFGVSNGNLAVRIVERVDEVSGRQ